MKKFLAVVALVAVSAVHAEELKFGDLNYFLKQGQLNLVADVRQDAEETRYDGDDFKVDGYYLNTQFAYAIANNLNAFIGLDFVYRIDTHAQTANDSVFTTGLQNPHFGANYRLLNQDSSAVNLDFGVKATVKVTDREVSSTARKDEGNMVDPSLTNFADPRNTVELNARLGKKWNEANEFYLIAGAMYHLDGKYEDLASRDDVDMDASLDFKLGGFYQYRPVNEFMITLGAVATRYSELDGEVANTDFTRTDHTDVQLSFGAKYLITETFIFKFDFATSKRGNFYNEVEGAADQKVDKRLARSYGIGFDFLF